MPDVRGWRVKWLLCILLYMLRVIGAASHRRLLVLEGTNAVLIMDAAQYCNSTVFFIGFGTSAGSPIFAIQRFTSWFVCSMIFAQLEA